jgi:F420-dependent oxidoreductase-like protein
MKLGLLAGYSPAEMRLPMELILEAEKLGFDSCWTAEAYGSDAVTPATWILANTTKIKVGTAIMQMPARTPTCAAMTAMTLDAMSGGRFILGIGPSGPQVAEGWYGAKFGKPLTKTREYIDIIRKVLERRAPLTHEGEHYSIPYNGEGATGLGKPLKSILHGNPDMKIYTAAITHNGVRTSAEVADGVFPIWMSPEKFGVFDQYVQEGLSKAGNGKSLKDFDIAPFVTCVVDDDIEKARMPVKGMMALYIGGMGAKDKNFYNDYAKRLGYEEAAVTIQDHFLGGRRHEAVAAVPDELVDECALVGPADRVRDRLQIWKEAGKKGHVGSMLAGAGSADALRLLAEEIL